MRLTTHFAVLSIAALAFSLPSIGSAQTVSRGPYLQICTPTSIVIRWRTDIPTDSRVEYDTKVGGSEWVAEDGAFTFEHEVTVTGLTPDTRYFYAIGSSFGMLAGGDASHRFLTHPTPGTRQAVRIWAIGDSGEANLNAARVRDAYLAHPGADATDVWLMLGDNAYDWGLDTEYQAAVFDMYPSLLRNTTLWPTRGNHDLTYLDPIPDYYDIFSMPTAGQAGGLASGTENYYAFDVANVHFICLDSQGSDKSPGGPMVTWLTQDLAATSQEWIIAYWHHPPYTKGSHDSDDPIDSIGFMILMRQNVLPVLEAGGVDLVLTGHSHSYERSFLLNGHYGFSWELNQAMIVNPGDGRIDGDGAYLKPTFGPGANEGAVYAVAGSSSKTSGGTFDHPVMVTSLNELGSMVIDIRDNTLEAAFIDDAGNVRDHFTLIKGMTATGIDDVPAAGPRLLAGTPNPFVSETRIGYSLPRSGPVKLAIYDARGRRIRALVDGDEAAGDHMALWDGRNANGRPVAGGVYFAILEFAGERRTGKLVLIR